MKTRVTILILCWLTLFSSVLVGQKEEKNVMKRVPQLNGDTYNCEDMVRVVNELRKLGKANALNVLEEYAKDVNRAGGNDVNLLLICRLLFVNPNGWNAPRIGEASPQVRKSVSVKFPLFPLALSDKVPFLVVKGYNLGGATSDTGVPCIQQCKNFAIISSDLPDRGYNKAAKKLIQSEEFRQLYTNPEDLKEMESCIMGQAEGTVRVIKLASPEGKRWIESHPEDGKQSSGGK